MRRVEMPPAEGVKVRVLRITSTSPTPMMVVGASVHWLVQHWDGYCCRPCTLDVATNRKCKGCSKQWPERIKGYLHVARSKENLLLELTRDGALRLFDAVGGEDALRGTTVQAWRQAGPKSALLFSRLERPRPLDLIPEIDPAPHVESFLSLDPKGKRKAPAGEGVPDALG